MCQNKTCEIFPSASYFHNDKTKKKIIILFLFDKYISYHESVKIRKKEKYYRMKHIKGKKKIYYHFKFHIFSKYGFKLFDEWKCK